MFSVGSLCTGYGGLEMGLQAVYGDIDLRFVSDIDKNASTLLAHHHPDIPNLGDLTVVDWPDIEPVDVLCAGYPCQPFSYAGFRKGNNDDRAIFEYIADAISVLRPRHLLLENVAGHLTLGGTTVIATLTRLGYNAKWGIVRASDTGAPHQRKRLFIWCETEDTNSKRKRETTTAQGRQGQVRPSGPVRQTIGNASFWNERQSMGTSFRSAAELRKPDRSITTDTNIKRSSRQNPRRTDGINDKTPKGNQTQYGHVTESDGACTERFDFRQYKQAIRRWEAVMGRIAPLPVDNIGVNPVFVEWVMGLPEGHVTSLDISRAGS